MVYIYITCHVIREWCSLNEPLTFIILLLLPLMYWSHRLAVKLSKLSNWVSVKQRRHLKLRTFSVVSETSCDAWTWGFGWYIGRVSVCPFIYVFFLRDSGRASGGGLDTEAVNWSFSFMCWLSCRERESSPQKKKRVWSYVNQWGCRRLAHTWNEF